MTLFFYRLSRLNAAVVFVVTLLALSGCRHLRGHGADQYLYVVTKTTFLRDRVAAVSNKVVDVRNGDRLTMLQHERRFYQVRTAAGKVGWLEEHAVVDQAATISLKLSRLSTPTIPSLPLRFCAMSSFSTSPPAARLTISSCCRRTTGCSCWCVRRWRSLCPRRDCH